MPIPRKVRQRVPRYPVSIGRLTGEEIELIDRAAALRSESRATYISRVVLRESRADLRRAERASADDRSKEVA